MSTQDFLQNLNASAEAAQNLLADRLSEFENLPLVKAMEYATQGGKGLRGFLVLQSAKLYGFDGPVPLTAAAAVEAMHAYSLVHDDLPCMDDDDLRRGQPTVHVKWDDATAVLVGDALQSLAFEMLCDTACHTDASVRVALVSGMAKAAGAQGMVLGQAQDIAAETADVPLTLDQIKVLQSHKTGALIEWSAQVGAVMAGADPTPLRAYSKALGLAFQIADDILDVEGCSTEVGKATGKDADAGKATFVSLMGLEGAKLEAERLVAKAISALAPFGSEANLLKDAARFVIERKK
ncbi:MAG: polyprenyl synthetase family protein [Planktomarina sp.]